MFGDLEEVYSDTLLDHAMSRSHRGTIENTPHSAEAHSPICGDDIELFLRFSGANQVVEARFNSSSESCEISRGSASMLAQEIEGQPLDRANYLLASFRSMLRGKPIADANEIGDLVCLQGLSKYPARVKCAWLPWAALDEILQNYQATTGVR